MHTLDKLPQVRGWGSNQVLRLGRDRVFVKRIPVTDKELVNAHSTRNVYNMPLYYSYGVGSAGFGVFRELLTHAKTTNWVLDGAIENFPLMFHHRIVKAGARKALHEFPIEQYVRYWAGSKSIGQYMHDRASASHEVLVFLEHFPHTVGPWLAKHEDRVTWVHAEMQHVAHFLQAQKILHFDGHILNIVTDGTRAYLADFGLALDMNFELTEKERHFFRRNSHYDEVYNYFNLGNYVFTKLSSLSKTKLAALKNRYGIGDAGYHGVIGAALTNIEDIVDQGFLKLPQSNFELVLKARPLALMLADFSANMTRGSRKNFTFDNARAKRIVRSVTQLPRTSL